MATPNQNQNPRKRKSSQQPDSDSEEDVRDSMPNGWAKSLIVKSVDETRPLTQLSPWAIKKWFSGVSKEIKEAKKMRNGAYLVKCPSRAVSDTLRKYNEAIFVDRQVTVSVHRSLNTCKGVIRCRDLEGMEETEIRRELREQGVIEVQRVVLKKNTDNPKPTNTFFLTFCTSSLPEVIDVGYLKVKVTPFVPSPLRCFNCQRFGHT